MARRDGDESGASAFSRKLFYKAEPRWTPRSHPDLGSGTSAVNPPQMRVPLLLATLASCARPAASFASMPSGAIPADDLIEALVELALTNCTSDERASHTRGLETAAAAVVKDGDKNDDGMIDRAELERMKRSAEEEVGDTADAVIATLEPGECLVDHILDETSAMTSGNGRRLALSRRLQRRSLSVETSSEFPTLYGIIVSLTLVIFSRTRTAPPPFNPVG